MYKAAGLATLAVVANGAASDFPSFDPFHANCAMTSSFAKPCHEIYTNVDGMTKDVTGPANGKYKLKEEALDAYIWTTRTTPVHKYVDDIIFEFTAVGDSACNVSSKSKSRTLSYYDYETNYCNMWNVLSRAGDMKDLKTNHCKWVPSDATTRCAKY